MSKEGVLQTQGYRRPKKMVKLAERDGVIGKECTKCGEWKPTNEFHKNKKTSTGLSAECKVCKAQYYRANKSKIAKVKAEYQKRTKAQRSEYYREHYAKIKENRKAEMRSYVKENKEKMTKAMKRWREENPEMVRLQDLKRKARKRLLTNDFSINEMTIVLNLFNGSCTLTGEISGLHWDHVIPLATGHGGTTYGNMIPLRGDLNISKNDSNIFEWFEANRQRFELSQERFDNLIAYLASANAMTVEEYRDHVYWCHANPRNIDELEAN